MPPEPHIWRLTLVALVALAAVVWLLHKLNLPKPMRYRQQGEVLTALGAAGGALYAYFKYYPPIQAQVEAALTPVLTAVAQLLRADPLGWEVTEGVHVLLNLGLLLAFAGIKLINNGVQRLVAWFRKEHAPSKRLLFHRHDPEHGVLIREEWVLSGILARRLAFLAAIPLFVALIFDATLLPVPVMLTLLPAPALVVLLELGWFLDGARPADSAERFGGDDVTAEKAIDYQKLWERYQKIWPERVLVATDKLALPRPEHHPISYRQTPDADPQTYELERLWNDLLSRGHTLTPEHFNVLSDLQRGHDVLISSVIYDDLAPVLFAALHAHLIDGHRILVLVEPDRRDAPARQEEVARWLRTELGSYFDGAMTWQVETLDHYRRVHDDPHVLVSSAGALLNADTVRERWFEAVDVVLALNASATVMNHLPSVRALIQVLRAHSPSLQLIATSDGRKALESGMRGFLTGNFREHHLAGSVSDNVFVLTWQLEGEHPFAHAATQRGLLSGSPDYLGAEPVLALLAWQAGVREFVAVGQEEQPWDEFVEELAKDDTLRAQHFKENSLGPSEISWMAKPREQAPLLVHDREHNLIAALREYIPLGRRLAFVNLVSPPYLLRDYFADNVEFFLATPLFAQALTPRLAATSRYAVAYGLLERLVAGPMTEAEVLDQLRSVLPEARVVEDALHGLFLFMFDLDLRERGYLKAQRDTVFNEATGAFEEITFFRLDPHIKNHDHLGWLRRYQIVDDGGHVQGFVTADHLYQTYLPGQVHTFRTQEHGTYEDKPFEVVAIDPATATVRTRHRPAQRHLMYRPALQITVDDVHDWSPPETVRKGRLTIERRLGKGRFRVKTKGYYTFLHDLSMREGAYTFTEVRDHDVPVRVYPAGRLMHLKLKLADRMAVEERHAVARTLAVLCNEAFVTLFPETHTLLHACVSPRASTSASLATLRHALPYLALEWQDDGRSIDLYFVEDSTADVGLVQAMFTEWSYVLEQLGDYLTWLLKPSEKPSTGWKKQIADRDTFLRYGKSEVSAALDLEKTKSILNALFLTEYQITAQRRGYYSSAHEKPPTQDDGTVCDFCGRPTASKKLKRLPDGRERCQTCTGQAVDTVKGLKKVYKEARAFLTGRFDLKLTRDIDIRFANPQEIAAAHGGTFLPTADFDERAIGLAIQDGPGHYAILIENGQPYHLMLETVAHELTHIWQFDHLDVQRMHAEHGLLLIEGHALWAGLQCLEAKGIAKEHIARQVARNDVYGAGYRHLLHMLRTRKSPSPFTLLRTQYPKR